MGAFAGDLDDLGARLEARMLRRIREGVADSIRHGFADHATGLADQEPVSYTHLTLPTIYSV